MQQVFDFLYHQSDRVLTILVFPIMWHNNMLLFLDVVFDIDSKENFVILLIHSGGIHGYHNTDTSTIPII